MHKIFNLDNKRHNCKGVVKSIVNKGLKDGNCPICNLLSEVETKTIKHILYEEVNDPGVRAKFRESIGLCPFHAWMIVKIVSDPKVIDGLGATIIYKDILGRYLDNLVNNRENIGGKCFLCEYLGRFEEIYIKDYIECLVSDRSFLDKYINSDSIFCDRHFKMIYSSIQDENLRKTLLDSRVKKIKNIIKNMDEYIRKHDYRVNEEITKEESSAWVRTVEILKGGYNSINIIRESSKYI